MTRVLHHFPLCPFSRKIRLQLAEKRLASEIVEDKPWEHTDEDEPRLNPSGEVPVLQDGSRTICDSYAIAEYLEESYREVDLLGAKADDRIETRRIMAWFDAKFNREVTERLWREKLLKRLKRLGSPNSDFVRSGLANIHIHMIYICVLYDERNFLAGENLTLADLTAAAHLSVIDYLGDVPWETYPEAKEWYGKVKSRPSFQPLLRDRVVGIKPPIHYDDLDF
ncbi:MAG: glutathione S-transferase family protein [Geminicoccaceae bacterium]